MTYTCPICGFPDLTRDPGYFACFEICPSCFFHFSVDDRDRGFTYDQWREDWIRNGMIWGGGHTKAPKGWNPKKQLENVSKIGNK